MNQTKQIIEYLETGKTLTPMDALQEFGCFRLAARIKDAKDMGVNIRTKIEKKDGKKYARYSIMSN